MSTTYKVNEIFVSPQGEGVRAGTINTFIRLTGCNLRCSRDGEAGFDCDTEFTSGTRMTLDEIWAEMEKATPYDVPQWIIVTGGEPALQLDAEFCDYFHAKGCLIAVETNGTLELPRRDPRSSQEEVAIEMRHGKATLEVALSHYLVDYITVSPKSAEHTLKQLVAHELRYVRNAQQGLPVSNVNALHYVLSPAFSSVSVSGVAEVDPRALATCIDLCKRNPKWRLSVQQHKLWRVR